MTATQMAYEFEVGYDYIANFDAAGILPKEISTFLTKAQEEIVYEIYKGEADVEYNKRVLNILKTYTKLTTQALGGKAYSSNTASYDIAANLDLLFIINERATITGSTEGHFLNGITISDVKVLPVDDDYYNYNINNPFKKPNEERVWRLDYATTSNLTKLLYVHGADFTVDSIDLHYYRKPNPIIVSDSSYDTNDGYIDNVQWESHTNIDLNCELDSVIHRKIVDRAIKIAHAALKDKEGFQISSAQEQQNV